MFGDKLNCLLLLSFISSCLPYLLCFLYPTGQCEEYELPFQGVVPPDPSLDEMRAVVVDEKKRPPIPHRWKTDEVYHNMHTSSPVHIHVDCITAWRINVAL